MDWGIQNRLNRLIQKDGKALFLPIDHGYFQGPTRKLEKPGETIKPLVQYADAVMMTRGILRNCVDPAIEKPIILRVSGGNSVVGDDLSNEEHLTSITEILRLNASAVSMSIYVGGKYEHQTLKSFSRLVDQCEDYGIPTMAVTAVGRELEKRDDRYLAFQLAVGFLETLPGQLGHQSAGLFAGIHQDFPVFRGKLIPYAGIDIKGLDITDIIRFHVKLLDLVQTFSSHHDHTVFLGVYHTGLEGHIQFGKGNLLRQGAQFFHGP